jgi:hypothetical protein
MSSGGLAVAVIPGLTRVVEVSSFQPSEELKRAVSLKWVKARGFFHFFRSKRGFNSVV